MISENERKHTSGNPLRRMAIQNYFNVISRVMPDVSKAVSAGCGEGYDTRLIQQDFPNLKMVGVDLSFEALLKAQTIVPHMPAVQADVTQLPFASRSVDLVISLEVLEHLPDPDAAIECYKTITRRYLLLGVPNEPWFRLMRMASGMNIRDFGDHPEHIQHWGLRGFKSLLRSHDLKILHAESPVPFIWSIVLCEL